MYYCLFGFNKRRYTQLYFTEPLFSKQILIKHDSCTVNSFSKKTEWFDHDCKQAKQLYTDYLNKFNRWKLQKIELKCVTKCLFIRHLLKRRNDVLNIKNLKDIERLRHGQPKDFWKLFSNKIKSNKSDDAATFCSNYYFNSTNCSFEELDMPITVSEIEKKYWKLIEK